MLPQFTQTSEKALETLVVQALQTRGWLVGNAAHFNVAYGLDLEQLRLWLEATQPQTAAALDLENDSPTRRDFLARLQGEITKKGVVNTLRAGFSHRQWNVQLYGATPSPHNQSAKVWWEKNRWSVSRQVHFSPRDKSLSIDLVLFLNGIPILTLELKNSLTKQNVADAVAQYRDRLVNGEPLLQPKRTLVHLAVDDREVQMCVELCGASSWFLPFNQGFAGGAGNPPNPNGLQTAYLWDEILRPASLADILENYAAVVKTERRDPKTGAKVVKETPIFPRFHQLKAARALLGDALAKGAGQKYLVQHSAGSGKSNTIAWLAHQLVGLKTYDENGVETPVFDAVVVINDRKILDKQLDGIIAAFRQNSALSKRAESANELRQLLQNGQKIISSTVQKFPFILGEMKAQTGKKFAVIIDEAHSSQGSRMATALNRVLGGDFGEFEDEEAALEFLMKSRLMAPNASYFAFTATPKNKTLELFGTPFWEGETRKFAPFPGCSYTMKQAVEEGFILDVLQFYTPVESYYKLQKAVEDDPMFDAKRAAKRLRRWVEGHQAAVRAKAEIMIEHFEEQVVAPRKIGGAARAMVVCDGIERAVEYFEAFEQILDERKIPFRALVAFSGEIEKGGKKWTQDALNGFAAGDSDKVLAERFVSEPYRFLICADKFQTGFDEPLLHTMYVDKPLGGVQAVQTLSRLNRAHPKKRDCFVLDFYNDAQTITGAFAPYYQSTILSQETDPNKLHDLQSDLEGAGVYEQSDLETVVSLFLSGQSREKIDAVVDACVPRFKDLSEDEQIRFKGRAKAFGRAYDFLAATLPYTVKKWEQTSILLFFLVPKLPAPKGEDLSVGVLETVALESYRSEKQAMAKLLLPDQNSEIAPATTGTGGGASEADLQRISEIVNAFNERFGTAHFEDADRIHRMVAEEFPAKIARDPAFQNALKSRDKANTRLEFEDALERTIGSLVDDDLKLFGLLQDNPDFKKSITEMLFNRLYGGQ